MIKFGRTAHGEDINKQLTLLLFKKKKREDRSGSQKRKTHKKPNQMTKITTFLAIDLTSSVDDTNNFTKKKRKSHPQNKRDEYNSTLSIF